MQNNFAHPDYTYLVILIDRYYFDRYFDRYYFYYCYQGTPPTPPVSTTNAVEISGSVILNGKLIISKQ